MICSRCGKKTGDDAVICSKCGVFTEKGVLKLQEAAKQGSAVKDNYNFTKTNLKSVISKNGWFSYKPFVNI